MAMRKYADIASISGKYTNKDGEEKNKYINHGFILEDDVSGKFSIKMESIPLAKIGKDGFPAIWLSVFPVDNENDSSRVNTRARLPRKEQGRFDKNDNPPPMPPADAAQAPDDNNDDDIPF